MRDERPEMMGWEITHRCNLACPHCYSAAARKAVNELSTEECFRIIDVLERLGLSYVGWTGGEPLLREDLEEIIAYCTKARMKSAITTNGILLDEKRASSLKEAGITSIQISLDGSTAELNAKMRKATTEDFDKVMEGIRICVKLGYRVHMAMMIGQENLEDAEAFVRLATREKVTSVRFCGFVPWGRGKGQQNRLAFTEKLPALKSFVERFDGQVEPLVAFDPAFGPLPPEYRFHACMAGLKMLYLTANGDVYPCTSLLDKRFRVGNVRERPLWDIWHDPKMGLMAAYSRDNIHGHCRKCRFFGGCHGACRGITFAHTGDTSASFPVCLSCAEDGSYR